MFNETGGKLKLAAFIYLVGGIILSLIYGLILMTESFAGIIVIIVGSFFSWVMSLLIHAAGEVVDEIKQSNKNTYGIYRELEKLQTGSSDSSSSND